MTAKVNYVSDYTVAFILSNGTEYVATLPLDQLVQTGKDFAIAFHCNVDVVDNYTGEVFFEIIFDEEFPEEV